MEDNVEGPKSWKMLTAAEKKALAKQLALQNKLMKEQQQEEAERQIVRDNLTREIQYGDMARKELQAGWKPMLLDLKLPVFKKELQVTVNNMERWIEAKDYKISLLLDELDFASSQDLNVKKTHLLKIGELIDVFHDQLDHLRDKFDEDFEHIFMDKIHSFEILDARKSFNEDFLKMMFFNLDAENKYNMKEVRSNYMSKINTETEWYNYRLIDSKTEYGITFRTLWNEYNNFFGKYLEYKKRVLKQYNDMRQRDFKIQQLIERLNLEIIENYEVIKKLKYLEEIEKRDLDLIYADLKDEKKYFNGIYKIFKTRLLSQEKADGDKQIELIKISHEVITHLSRVKDKGEKVLRYMSVCDRYRTLEEKILPFPELATDKRMEQTYYRNLKKGKVTTNTWMPHMSNKFLNFWQKVAAADATRNLLNEEKAQLKKKNAMLREMVKKYCEDAACRCMFPTVLKIKPRPEPTETEKERSVTQLLSLAKCMQNVNSK